MYGRNILAPNLYFNLFKSFKLSTCFFWRKKQSCSWKFLFLIHIHTWNVFLLYDKYYRYYYYFRQNVRSSLTTNQLSAETSNQLKPAISWYQQSAEGSNQRTELKLTSRVVTARDICRWLDILTFRGLLTEVRLIFSYWF